MNLYNDAGAVIQVCREQWEQRRKNGECTEVANDDFMKIVLSLSLKWQEDARPVQEEEKGTPKRGKDMNGRALKNGGP